VVALRNLSGKQALNYSKSLVKGQWWRVAGISILFFALNFFAMMVVSVPLAFISENPFFTVVNYTLIDIVAALFDVMTIVFFLNTEYLRTHAAAFVEAPLILPQV